jgi:hypothetical protein
MSQGFWDTSTIGGAHEAHGFGQERSDRGKRVIILMADLDVRVIDEDGVVLRHFELDPAVDYQAQARDIV